MKSRIAFIAIAVGGGLLAHVLFSRPLYVLAGDDVCVQPIYEVTRLPAGIDPNLVQGLLLPPIPGDETTWEMQVGKFNRSGRACDPEGHVFDVVVVEATSSTTVYVSTDEGIWTLACETLPGLNLVVLDATDAYGATQRFTVAWLGVGNERPVLCTERNVRWQARLNGRTKRATSSPAVARSVPAARTATPRRWPSGCAG